MEIKTVGELIPYKASLQELWGQEEFQPVLALLRGMKEEAVMNVRTIQDFDTPDGIKTHALKAKFMLNLTSMLIELPSYIQKAQDDINASQNKAAAMKSATEGGSI